MEQTRFSCAIKVSSLNYSLAKVYYAVIYPVLDNVENVVWYFQNMKLHFKEAAAEPFLEREVFFWCFMMKYRFSHFLYNGEDLACLILC